MLMGILILCAVLLAHADKPTSDKASPRVETGNLSPVSTSAASDTTATHSNGIGSASQASSTSPTELSTISAAPTPASAPTVAHATALVSAAAAGKGGSHGAGYYRQQGEKHLNSRDYQTASEDFRQYMRLVTPPDPRVLCHLALCDTLVGRKTLGEREFQQASELQGETLEGYLSRFDSRMAANNHDQALASASECCQRFPKEWKSYWRLGFFYNTYREQERAIEAYSKALELRANSKSEPSTSPTEAFEELSGRPELSRIYGLRAGCLYRIGKYAEAIADCDQFIQGEPTNPQGYESRGEARLRLHNLTQAADDFQKSIDLKTKRVRSYKQLGFCQLQQGKYQDAVASLSVAIERHPKYAEAFHLRAQAMKGLGQYASAAEDERTATRLGFRPDDSV